MNVSVVVTVLNEGETITPLLRSLLHQNLKPDELIIVDGGSSDSTIEKISDFKKKHPHFSIQLIEEEGNISHGRNFGISKAENEIVALTDAGCVAHPDWLKKLTEPFSDKEVGVVAGFYKMKVNSPLQEAVAPFHGVPLRKLDPRNFMPSARSVAFRKSVWSEVGGFSEGLVRAGEDTLFNYAVIKKKIKIEHRPDALVDWEVPNTLKLTAKKFYYYALGDAQTGIWWHPAKKFNTHNIKVLTIFGRYLVLFWLFFMGLTNSFILFLFVLSLAIYISWSAQKVERDVSSPKALLLIPVIQILSDFCVMSGFLSGIIQNGLQKHRTTGSILDRGL